MLAVMMSMPAAAQVVNALTKARREAYWKHEPQDLCTDLLKKVAARTEHLSSSSQEALTRSLLSALNVPVSSQMLAFSGSASQGSRVNSKNARAVFFNDEVYIGMVPGGFVEVIGVDPEFGGVFYSFEKMRGGSTPAAERPEDCMRCHATPASGLMPGMIARSVIPSLAGGRVHENIARTVAGHQIPLEERFGGWCVSSAKPFGPTKEGLIAVPRGGNVKVEHLKLSDLYDATKHLTRSSDILAHLLHEHQMGFVNRVANLLANARDAGPDQSSYRLAPLERELVRYIFFADEAKLPPGGIVGLPRYVQDFTANRKPTKAGASLKDLDLSTRLFKHRCSYMIYTRQWQLMPAPVKTRLYARMKAALSGTDREFAYLPEAERHSIIAILRETVPDLPADWR